LIRIFSCFAFAYFLSYALRSVNAVIAPALTTDLALNAEQLGKLSSAYLLTFALMQVPLGLALDRFGARRTESVLLLFAAAGCLVFSQAHTLQGLWVGRALIGIGVCGCLMAAFKGFRDWFDAALQTRLAAWMLVAGTCGVLTTTVPAQWVVQKLGWRPLFLAAALLLCVSSALLFLFLPKTHDGQSAASTRSDKQVDRLNTKTILSQAYFWRMALLISVFGGGFVAMQSLWVGPWMTTVLGFSTSAAAQNLFFFNFALMLAYLALGAIVPRIEARGLQLANLAIGFNLVGVLSLVAIALLLEKSAWWLWLLLAASATINTVLQPRVAMFLPKALAGRANAWLNLMIFVGAFALQWGFGLGVEFFKRSGSTLVQSYQATLWCYVAVAALTLFVYCVWRPKPRLVAE
jgi:MFS family permease